MIRKINFDDAKIVLKVKCPECQSTGFKDITSGQCTCSHCNGVPDKYTEVKVSFLELVCLAEEYKHKNPQEVQKGLTEVYGRK